MNETIQWLGANYGQLIIALTAILGGLAVIAKLTPTPKDDAIISKVLQWLNLVQKK